jgi:hypothetical protein
MRAFCWKASLSDSAGLELMQPMVQELDKDGRVSITIINYAEEHEEIVKQEVMTAPSRVELSRSESGMRRECAAAAPARTQRHSDPARR